ncbi:MAG: 16S rRNA (guanine(966)-N(2))-methyltransferase RsmD [Alphaproteobacteria bacterium]
MPSRLRIVGGRFRGRQLAVPDGRGTRPTTDRVREALFNILEHRDPPVLAGATVLDLFAGTGALGLEALSRGAEQVVFVEKDRKVCALLKANVETLGAQDETRVLCADAAWLGQADVKASLVFVDAPYGKGLVGPALTQASAKGWIADGAIVVVELDAEEGLDVPPGFVSCDTRTYGGTKLVLLAFAACRG